MSPVQKDGKPNKQQNKDDRTPRNRCAANRSESNVLIPVGETADSTFLENNLRNPSIQRESPNCDYQGGQCSVDDDQSIDKPRQRSDHDTQHHGQFDWESVFKTYR